jgi:hypothetical protein
MARQKKPEAVATSKSGKTYTKAQIVENLKTDDRWLYRGILAIYAGQTAEEQASRETQVDNGIGFSGSDAELLSSFAEQLKVRGRLTNKQIELARKKMTKYAGQLLRISSN